MERNSEFHTIESSSYQVFILPFFEESLGYATARQAGIMINFKIKFVLINKISVIIENV